MSLLHSSLFAFAESTLNRIIALDDLLLQDLRELAGTVLALHSTQPSLSGFLVIQDHDTQPLRLVQHYETAPDVRISGSLTALMSLLHSGGRELHDLPLDIEGDMSTAQRLQQLLSASSIDWRYQLGRVLGDVPAQSVGDAVDKGREQACRTADSLLSDLDEYIHEEQRLLPGKAELEMFYLRINQLQLRIDRLEARISQYQQERS